MSLLPKTPQHPTFDASKPKASDVRSWIQMLCTVALVVFAARCTSLMTDLVARVGMTSTQPAIVINEDVPVAIGGVTTTAHITANQQPGETIADTLATMATSIAEAHAHYSPAKDPNSMNASNSTNQKPIEQKVK